MNHSIYNISEKQLNVLKRALDMFVSMGVLKFDDCIISEYQTSFKKFSYNNHYRTINSILGSAKRLLVENHPDYSRFSTDHWNMGITSEDVPEDVKIAYELHGVIKKFILEKRGQNYHSALNLTDQDDIFVKESYNRIEKIENSPH